MYVPTQIQSTVVEKVTQKLFKELMLLGVISFGIFIIQASMPGLAPEMIHSFEFAHTVFFFFEPQITH